MTSVIELKKQPVTAKTLENILLRYPLFKRLKQIPDFLVSRIDMQKYLKSEIAGDGIDIGITAAVVDYFTDNPSHLLDLFPNLIDLSNKRKPLKCNCYSKIARARDILLPIAIKVHRGLMDRSSNCSQISYERVEEDFRKQGFFNDWLKRNTMASYLVLCENAEYNSSFQLAYKDLLKKRSEGCELIQTSSTQTHYADKYNFRQFLHKPIANRGIRLL